MKPNFVAIDRVKTDRDRTDAITDDFARLVEGTRLSDVMYHEKPYPVPRGYIAPRLEGVWARFPYLHNASVPSLRAMLTDPKERPTCFSLADAGEESRFDRNDVGLTVPDKDSFEHVILKGLAIAGARDVYYTRRVGQSNEGHAFGTNLPAADKDALIEYLKCL
jgi:hypothetical protein